MTNKEIEIEMLVKILSQSHRTPCSLVLSIIMKFAVLILNVLRLAAKSLTATEEGFYNLKRIFYTQNQEMKIKVERKSSLPQEINLNKTVGITTYIQRLDLILMKKTKQFQSLETKFMVKTIKSSLSLKTKFIRIKEMDKDIAFNNYTAYQNLLHKLL